MAEADGGESDEAGAVAVPDNVDESGRPRAAGAIDELLVPSTAGDIDEAGSTAAEGNIDDAAMSSPRAVLVWCLLPVPTPRLSSPARPRRARASPTRPIPPAYAGAAGDVALGAPRRRSGPQSDQRGVLKQKAGSRRQRAGSRRRRAAGSRRRQATGSPGRQAWSCKRRRGRRGRQGGSCRRQATAQKRSIRSGWRQPRSRGEKSGRPSSHSSRPENTESRSAGSDKVERNARKRRGDDGAAVSGGNRESSVRAVPARTIEAQEIPRHPPMTQGAGGSTPKITRLGRPPARSPGKPGLLGISRCC